MARLTLPELLGASLERHNTRDSSWLFVLLGLVLFAVGFWVCSA